MAIEKPPEEANKTLISASSELSTSQNRAFPIVGIGASAGGLEAFEQFFHAIPADSGIAFVLISHLDPSHVSLLSEILQRATTMPVIEALDQMAVTPNCVFVIPPNRDLAIYQGKLQLSLVNVPRGQRMPIDYFFRSLAEDQLDNAIGIILSGTGTDGTLGLRAILGTGGITLVQEPDTAKYDGMPSSAIHAGYATHILSVDKMPEVLLSNRHCPIGNNEVNITASSNSIANILMQLRMMTGHDFSLYKKSTISRRIERRMLQHNIDDIAIYSRYLKENPAEIHILFKELLINVTNFFRDPDAFLELEHYILPNLCENKPEDYAFRVWVAGCATGEEAYSIAMLLREQMDSLHQGFKIQIYSTDLDDDAITIARLGFYPLNIVQDVSPERLRRFFIKEETGYRIKKEIRDMVVFAVQNIIKDPPFTRLDLLSCRNLLIYLKPELQDRLIPAFHYALKPNGVLFLSPSESIGNHIELFTALNRKWKFYRAIQSALSSHFIMSNPLGWVAKTDQQTHEAAMKKSQEINFAELTRRLLIQFFAPASVVTDLKGDILYVHGDTGHYLRPAPGRATLNIIEMARNGLDLELRAAIHSAATESTATLNKTVSIKINNSSINISLSVRPLSRKGNNRHLLLISFQDLPVQPETSKRKSTIKPVELKRIEELELDLTYLKESHQANLEEQQASNEELKSANEELQSTNEELQSTNEELETSKEELQSVNEELITVNIELQAKIEQLACMQNDMKNLLDNINVGIIFLDQQLCIRRFTREATRIYRLVTSDVGRPLNDIKSVLTDDHLLVAAQSVLDSLIPYESEICIDDNSWILLRIQPYRTLNNVIDGVVLTFTDITARIKAVAIQEALLLAENLVNAVNEPFIVIDDTQKVVFVNQLFYQTFQISPELIVGRLLDEIGDALWHQSALRSRLINLLANDLTQIDDFFEGEFPAICSQKIRLNARRLNDQSCHPQFILLSMEIIS